MEEGISIALPKPVNTRLLSCSRFLLPVEIGKLSTVIHLSLEKTRAQGINIQGLLDEGQGFGALVDSVPLMTKSLLGPGNKLGSDIMKLPDELEGWVPLGLELPEVGNQRQ